MAKLVYKNQVVYKVIEIKVIHCHCHKLQYYIILISNFASSKPKRPPQMWVTVQYMIERD